jgi:hypothetical protein
MFHCSAHCVEENKHNDKPVEALCFYSVTDPKPVNNAYTTLVVVVTILETEPLLHYLLYPNAIQAIV